LHMPEGIRRSFDGNAGDISTRPAGGRRFILGSLVARYIVSGVLTKASPIP